jgi:Resolvase, N terminal domain
VLQERLSTQHLSQVASPLSTGWRFLGMGLALAAISPAAFGERPRSMPWLRTPPTLRHGHGVVRGRLGHSLQDLVGFLSNVHAYGVDLFLHQQGLDTTTPSGRMMFQMLGLFAEFERARLVPTSSTSGAHQERAGRAADRGRRRLGKAELSEAGECLGNGRAALFERRSERGGQHVATIWFLD